MNGKLKEIISQTFKKYINQERIKSNIRQHTHTNIKKPKPYFERIRDYSHIDQKYQTTRKKFHHSTKPFTKILQLDHHLISKHIDKSLLENFELDLHHSCIDTSYHKLLYTFEEAVQKQIKVIKVITGKGNILQQYIPSLLKRSPFNIYIKKIERLDGSLIIFFK